MYDVIIVGAGPVGLYAAGLLEENLRVAVLEDHKIIGGKACSGLYSTKIEKFLDLPAEAVQNEVRGARFHSPNVSMELKKNRVAAHVVDRDMFNRHLAKAIKSKVFLGHKVTSVDVGGDFVQVNTTGKKLAARMILGCDGANSAVRRHFGVKPRELVNGLIAITGEKDHSDSVDLWFDKKRIRDGFFWKIPRGETTEYGALGNNVTFRQLEGFFGLKEYEKRAAFIPVGPCRSYFDRTLLLGDAAGITKPWSGGGVIYGLTCATIAKYVITQAFSRDDFTAAFLKAYEDEWKKSIGKSIRLGMVSRAVFKRMGNRSLDLFFSRAKKMKSLSRLDMDFPSMEIFG